ncbi:MULTISPECIES: SOS response-associated peptidase [Cytobacillus]|uniref:Abasic site processing protein n=1 Tax=Cytobacillus stercorigallinarum TaxID=2762240 RepID=A0ABR8QVP0_9BACI|nr:SOS response-associated peptidase [Cytobacillus stercorigallinarum]MBD7939616.1 SOS response-associated peptidase [Cytobacillus stercorigallinarum]
MCGRFTLSEEVFILQKTFEFYYHEVADLPRYNIAPGQKVLAIIEEQGEKVGRKMTWGFIPPWSKAKHNSTSFINARAESVDVKPSFKHSFRTSRCLVLADGFYEWKKIEGHKSQPFHFTLLDKRPFAMAGIWSEYRQGDELFTSCCILTTAANEIMSSVHHRMPVMLTGDAGDKWIYSNDTLQLKSLCKPFGSDEMQMVKVSELVNSVHNDYPELLNSL